MKRQRSAPAARAVLVSLDGEDQELFLTAQQERRLRTQLAPFVAAARVIKRSHPEPEPGTLQRAELAAELRAARLRALLQLPETKPGTREFSEELRRLVDRTVEVYARSLAENTASTYRRRWVQFEAWCQQHGCQALPASPETVMLYLSALIGTEPQPALSTLRGRVTAIDRVHRDADLASPGSDELVATMMRGLSRTVPAASGVGAMSALRIADLRDLCRSLAHPDPVAVRDCALLHLTAAGLDAGHLSRLRWTDLAMRRDGGVDLALRTAWQRDPDSVHAIAKGPTPRSCPVTALLAWRDLAGTQPDHVFTGVDRQGHRHPRRITRSQLQELIDSRLDSLGPQGSAARADPATAAQLLQGPPNDVLRDRAMLLVGWAGAFRRGEVTRLLWGDVRIVDEGLILRLRQSKTDTYSRGRDVGIPLGRSLMTCPVRATLAWRQRMQEQLGPQFDEHTTPCWPKVGRSGRITADQPISPEGLTMVVRRRAAAAGIDGRWGGRSLRAGFISTAADLELPLEMVAAQSRHASLDNLLRYVRAEDVFRRNAADRVGL